MLNSLVGDLLIYIVQWLYVLILFNDKNVLIECFAIHNVHVFLQDHQSDVQLLPSRLFGNVDLHMDLLCLSEAYSTFKAYYAGFMRWKKLLRMVLTWWIYSQEIRFMLHLYIFFNTNKSYRQSRYYSLHWAHTVWENISD